MTESLFTDRKDMAVCGLAVSVAAAITALYLALIEGIVLDSWAAFFWGWVAGFVFCFLIGLAAVLHD